VQWQDNLIVGYERAGSALASVGDMAGALAMYRDGLAAAQRLAEKAPDNPRWERAVAIGYERIGGVQAAQDDFAGALASFRASLALRQRLARSAPTNLALQRDLSVVTNNVGNMLALQGELKEALEYFRVALAIRKDLITRDSRNRQWQQDLQISADRLGALAYKFVLARDFVTALAVVDEAIAVAPGTIWLYGNRAHALMFLGRTDEARALYLQYRGRAGVEGDKSWADVIGVDFADLRKAGLTNPLMDEIETALRGGG
jgi:tetratricopeptide (TPR) repeat protein